MIDCIGEGDAKSILLNAAEKSDPKDKIILLIKKEDGDYIRFNNKISYEDLCAMYVHLQWTIMEASK